MKIFNQLFIILQKIIPQHWLSLRIHKLMRSKNVMLKNILIKNFIKLYKVDMQIAVEKEPINYVSFNDFFVRELTPESRPICVEKKAIASPVDGAVSQLGSIDKRRIFQAKGKYFSLSALLANDQNLAEKYANGSFSTLYLSPKDYHRIHMPIDGILQKMIYVPGDLYAVNQRTVTNLDELFSRNERLICLFQTEVGQMALIMVGAIFVGSMETVWHDQMITPPYRKKIKSWDYDDGTIALKKGEEMGRFNMGSTVVLLFGQDQILWQEDLILGSALEMGQKIGQIS